MIKRYSRPEMAAIWSDENKFRTWLRVEVLACEAMADVGEIPMKALKTIKEKADFDIDRILEIEDTVKHDVIAFLTNVAEYVGPDSRYIHLGMTSSDLLDTTLAVQMRQAGKILMKDLQELLSAIAERAIEYKDTPCIGRSHGVHAEPTTFGLKMAIWYEEVKRGIQRLKHAIDTISVGQISGAVGTFAHINPLLEGFVCAKLGLKPAPVSTQVIQRDRHAEFLTALALIASSLEKFSTEIRNLQRTEILEVEESFSKGQKGSSAMPHKRNPVSCEQITGIARVVRSNIIPALENVALWHERDITHSSVERIIIPDSTTGLDYILNRMTTIVCNFTVYPENMMRNIELTNGLIYSQGLLLALARKGLTREDAYAIVQRNAMAVWEKGGSFQSHVSKDKDIKKHLTEQQVKDCFDLKKNLRNVDFIFKRTGLLANKSKAGSKKKEGVLSKETKVKKKNKVYEGNAIFIYETDNEDYYILEFTDDVIAPDGSRKGKIKGKGAINNQICAHLFSFLESYHVPTHFVQIMNENTSVVRFLEMLPVQVVMRNIATGDLVKKNGIKEGEELGQPQLEYYLEDGSKKDTPVDGDHLISSEQVTDEELQQIERYTRKTNAVLKSYFYRRKMLLVDCSLAFGRSKSGKIKLGHELSPDTFNLWDIGADDKFDKNRFRQDRSKGEDAVHELYNRIFGSS